MVSWMQTDSCTLWQWNLIGIGGKFETCHCGCKACSPACGKVIFIIRIYLLILCDCCFYLGWFILFDEAITSPTFYWDQLCDIKLGLPPYSCSKLQDVSKGSLTIHILSQLNENRLKHLHLICVPDPFQKMLPCWGYLWKCILLKGLG